jgi:hypothetical protein
MEHIIAIATFLYPWGRVIQHGRAQGYNPLKILSNSVLTHVAKHEHEIIKCVQEKVQGKVGPEYSMKR